MMQYDEVTKILNDGGGDISTVLDPFAGIRELLPMLTVGFLVISLVVITLWIISIVARFRAERAMVLMQKDIKAVRQLLEQKISTSPSPVSVAPPDIPGS